MTEIATYQPTESVAHGVAVDSGKVLAYLGLNPTDPRSQAVVAVAQRYDLDPLLKHVIVIPKGGVYITRDGLLHVAHRSGQLDGIVVEQEPTLSEDGKEWVSRVSVYRKDMRHPFTFPGRYSVSGGNRDYAQEMSLKAAEAHALRRAFDVTGLPALDEQRLEQAQERPSGGLGAALAAQEPEAGPEEPQDIHEAEVVPDVPADTIGKTQLAKLQILLKEVGLTERDEALAYYARVTGREVDSSKSLTRSEAGQVIDDLERCKVGESNLLDPAEPTLDDPTADESWGAEK